MQQSTRSSSLTNRRPEKPRKVLLGNSDISVSATKRYSAGVADSTDEVYRLPVLQAIEGGSTKSVKLILQLSALATLGIGLGTLILPGVIIGWFAGDKTESHHFVRFIGTALIGFSVSNWIYSKFVDLKAVLPGIYGNMTSLCLAIAVDLIGLLLHQLNRSGWLILGVHVGFAAAFLYCILQIRRLNYTKREE